MRKSQLSRYARTDQGDIILDVAVVRVADLYEDIDRMSPFPKKDLDPYLADYLIEGAHEIADTHFVIRITLVDVPDAALQQRICHSVENYFTYMAETERHAMRASAKTAVWLLLAGLGFLTLAAYASDMLAGSGRIWAHVFPEGITVAGWVSLWHAIAAFLIQWTPSRNRIRIYRRLATTPILFSATTHPAEHSG